MFLDTKDSTRDQGDIGEALAVLEFTKIGWRVSKPLSVHCPYDLIVDDGEILKRVQVKTSQFNKVYETCQSWEVCLGTTIVKQAEAKQSWHKSARSKEFDLLFVLTADGDKWLIPEVAVDGNFTITLRRGGKYDKYRIRA